MPAMPMLHETDPAEDLFKRLGNLSGLHIQFAQVLVAIYVRPNQTKSGLYLADTTRDEDLYQGKAGLIVAMGPRAYSDTADFKFDASDVRHIGDWVGFRASDGLQLSINKVPCRLIQDVHCKLLLPSPDYVW